MSHYKKSPVSLIFALLLFGIPCAFPSLFAGQVSDSWKMDPSEYVKIPYFTWLKPPIAASFSGSQAKADATSALDKLVDWANTQVPPLNQTVSSGIVQYGLATGSVSIRLYQELVENYPGKSFKQTFRDVGISVTWPDAKPPVVTISPSTSLTIRIGDSVTFASTAAHAENELIKHNLEWQLPTGQWARNISGFDGDKTDQASALLSDAPNKTFSGIGQSTREIAFRPRMQGLFRVCFSAADKVTGFAYSSTTSIMVENIAPAQSLTAPDAVHVGDANFTITHTASNPTTLPDFLIGIRIFEQRLDAHENIYQL